MLSRWVLASLFFIALASQPDKFLQAGQLTVHSDFEGGSVRVLEIDAATGTIRFTPGGNPERGWPCWWFFRIDGIAPEDVITLRLSGSMAAIAQKKPLAATWAMPAHAAWSIDGEQWLQTDRGQRDEEWMVYTVKPKAASVYVAWGPPYTPSSAAKFVRDLSDQSPHAKVAELCRSREDRVVPMLHVREGERASAKRLGVWVQARQHAWESGSSWVAQGFGEWVISDSDEAAWLRQHAEIFIVPIMDIDNTATGNGGKDAIPQDHNRDWSAAPHWNEVTAAQRMIRGLIEDGRMDLFLDLHNPAPGDPTFFYVLPSELMKDQQRSCRDRFIDLASARIRSIQPSMSMSNKPKVTGPSYHPLWMQMSSSWVSMNGNPQTVSLCLETIWNGKNSTSSGYRSVGASLAAAVQEYFAERPEKR